MAFIQDGEIVPYRVQRLCRPMQPIVVDDQDIALAKQLFRFGGINPDDPDAQRPDEPLFQLPFPHQPHTGRTYNDDLLERGISVDQTDRLDGFSHSHFVR